MQNLKAVAVHRILVSSASFQALQHGFHLFSLRHPTFVAACFLAAAAEEALSSAAAAAEASAAVSAAVVAAMV